MVNGLRRPVVGDSRSWRNEPRLGADSAPSATVGGDKGCTTVAETASNFVVCARTAKFVGPKIGCSCITTELGSCLFLPVIPLSAPRTVSKGRGTIFVCAERHPHELPISAFMLVLVQHLL